MKNFVLYANGSAGNHGCEAITRSLIKILEYDSIHILSRNPDEDFKYGLHSLAKLTGVTDIQKKSIDYIKSYIALKLNKQIYALDLYPYINIIKGIQRPAETIAISVGGDNYCYGGADYFGQLDNLFHKRGIKTALVGCSIEPTVLAQPDIVKALKRHAAIVTRESITYNAMKEAGLTNIHLMPDPAFVLDKNERPLPKEFIPGNTIGLNLSPLVEELSSGGNIVYKNAVNLMNHILSNTNMNICLIPHVIWSHSDDFKILSPLYEEFKHTGRVSLIPDASAEVLKGYISRCRFLIAARTHASIAAYSTNVPTFVLGYSVKSRGIARDIFNDETNYVKATSDFSTDFELIDAFNFLIANESSIRDTLTEYNSTHIAKLNTLKTILQA